MGARQGLVASPFAPQASVFFVGVGLALSTTGVALEIGGAAIQGAATGGLRGAAFGAAQQVGEIGGTGLLKRFFPLAGAVTERGLSVKGIGTPLPQRRLCS